MTRAAAATHAVLVQKENVFLQSRHAQAARASSLTTHSKLKKFGTTRATLVTLVSVVKL